MLSIKQLAAALKEAAKWAEWEEELLDDFHRYAQQFHCQPGANVLKFALQDAIRYRSMIGQHFEQKEQHER